MIVFKRQIQSVSSEAPPLFLFLLNSYLFGEAKLKCHLHKALIILTRNYSNALSSLFTYQKLLCLLIVCLCITYLENKDWIFLIFASQNIASPEIFVNWINAKICHLYHED